MVKTEAGFAEYMAREASVSNWLWDVDALRDLTDETIESARHYHPFWLGNAHLVRGIAEQEGEAAEEAARGAEQAFRDAGAPSGVAWALWLRGNLAFAAADYAASFKVHHEALRIFKTIADPKGVRRTQLMIMASLSEAGSHEDALAIGDELLAEPEGRHGTIMVRRYLSRAHRKAGRSYLMCDDLREMLLAASESTSDFIAASIVETILIDLYSSFSEMRTRLAGWYATQGKVFDRSIPKPEVERWEQMRERHRQSLGARSVRPASGPGRRNVVGSGP